MTILAHGKLSDGKFVPAGPLAINPCNPDLILTPVLRHGKQTGYTNIAGGLSTVVQGSFNNIVKQIEQDANA